MYLFLVDMGTPGLSHDFGVVPAKTGTSGPDMTTVAHVSYLDTTTSTRVTRDCLTVTVSLQLGTRLVYAVPRHLGPQEVTKLAVYDRLHRAGACVLSCLIPSFYIYEAKSLNLRKINQMHHEVSPARDRHMDVPLDAINVQPLRDIKFPNKDSTFGTPENQQLAWIRYESAEVRTVSR